MSAVSAEDLLTEEKYTVRKANGEILAPGTYFVVKSTDLFAASGLWAYVHAMATVLEMNDTRPILSADEYVSLTNTADRAAELAGRWTRAGAGRLPD